MTSLLQGASYWHTPNAWVLLGVIIVTTKSLVQLQLISINSHPANIVGSRGIKIMVRNICLLLCMQELAALCNTCQNVVFDRLPLRFQEGCPGSNIHNIKYVWHNIVLCSYLGLLHTVPPSCPIAIVSPEHILVNALKLSILIPWKDQQIEVWILPNHIPDCNPKGIQYRMYCECS